MDEDEKSKVIYLRSHRESLIEHVILKLHHTISSSNILNGQVLVEIYESHLSPKSKSRETYTMSRS